MGGGDFVLVRKFAGGGGEGLYPCCKKERGDFILVAKIIGGLYPRIQK